MNLEIGIRHANAFTNFRTHRRVAGKGLGELGFGRQVFIGADELGVRGDDEFAGNVFEPAIRQERHGRFAERFGTAIRYKEGVTGEFAMALPFQLHLPDLGAKVRGPFTGGATA